MYKNLGGVGKRAFIKIWHDGQYFTEGRTNDKRSSSKHTKNKKHKKIISQQNGISIFRIYPNALYHGADNCSL